MKQMILVSATLMSHSVKAISIDIAALYIRHFGNESSCKQSKNPILKFPI